MPETTQILGDPDVPTLSDFTANTITGEEQPLETYAGKVALVVNTASKCGFTPQFEGLEKLHAQYSDKGLVVLGFPCNQFGSQESGTEEEIGEFCQVNYGVTFPITEKVDVNGPERHPLYQELVGDGPDIQWNFEKFLIAPDGEVAARYGPRTEPQDGELVAAVEKLLPPSDLPTAAHDRTEDGPSSRR
jgi:glutathione peroxidase